MTFHSVRTKASLALIAAGALLMAQLAPTHAAAPAVQIVSSGTPSVDQTQSPTGAKNGHPSKVVFHRTRNQAGLATSGGNLSYHGGPTERPTSLDYTIFWQPSGSYMSPTYQSLIERYFGDIGGSGLYNANTQYYDGSGNIVNSSSFGGAWIDTSVYPSGTLSDTQIQNELINAINANGWNWTNPDSEYFVFTAKGENSCLGSSCSFTQYCAYHSNVTLTDGVTTTPVRYANMPYTGTNLSACGVSTSPNGDIDADSTISVTSHEHMETVTDPLGTAWYDATGSEIGDKCSWNFGSVNLDGNQANEEWNGHYYIVQQEWSNASSGCVLTYGSNTAPSYSIAASPSSLTALAGGAAVTSNLTLSSSNGFSGNVNLTASSSPALPSGSTLSVSTPVAVSSTTPGSSALTVQIPSGASAGSYTLTVSGDGAAPAPMTTVTLNVSVPTYAISAASGSLTVQSGNSGTDGLTLTSSNGFSGNVNLTVSSSPALPAGVMASVTTPVAVSPTAAGSSTLTVQVPAGTPTTSYTLTISGDGATPAPTATVSLKISGPTPTFSMSASPTSLTVTRGSSVSSTITLTGANGYSSSVSLSASVPTNRISTSFTPNPMTPTSAGATSTLKINTSPRTQRGTYSVTVTGKGSDGTTQTTTLSLTVQ